MRSRIESSYAADLRQIGDDIRVLALDSPHVRTSSGDSSVVQSGQARLVKKACSNAK